MFTSLSIAAVVGYLLGALPWGYLVARAHGVNIFAVGSCNPGATNVRRTLGKGPGNLVFALDVLKGAVAVGWIRALDLWARSALGNAEGEWTMAVAGVPVFSSSTVLAGSLAGLVGALLGHSFSCFTGFRGGKGVATASGGLLVLMPLATLIAAVAWIVTFFASRYVSLASIVAALVLPLVAWMLGRPSAVVILAALIGVFVVVRHRANIARLVAGTENKFVKKSAGSPDVSRHE